MQLESFARLACPKIEKRRGRANDCVLELDEPPKLADPAIYSQEEQFAEGTNPTWNSPDIDFDIEGEGGQVSVTIRNLSPDTPAANVEVYVEASEWGIGFEREALGSDLVRSLPPGAQQVLHFERPTETGAFFVTISFTNDKNLLNNYGETAPQYLDLIVDPIITQVIQFPVRNEHPTPQQYELTAYSETGHVTFPSDTFKLDLDPEEVVEPVFQFALTNDAQPNEEYPVTILAETPDGVLVGGVTVIIRTGGDSE